MAITEAVIEIGSTGVRLLVAEISEDRKQKILDRSHLPLPLGRDVFNNASISREIQNSCVDILKRYAEQLKAWDILPEETAVLASSAFREAKNRDAVMDRILVQTGFRVHILDGIEENRLMYLAVNECLKNAGNYMEKNHLSQDDMMILEVGGNTTELMTISAGKMVGVHSFKLGTVRIEHNLRSTGTSYSHIQRYVRESISNTKGTLENEIKMESVRHFIAVGSDMVLAAVNCGKPVDTFLWEIESVAFDTFVKEIQPYSVDEIAARFKLPYNEAQTLQASLLVYNMFIQMTHVDKIVVPETNIRDGLIISKNSLKNEEVLQEFNSQIVASARTLLQKFHGDENHAECVRFIALKLFEEMKTEFNLMESDRLLLEIAAILHDIGIFIRLDHHNLHSSYIIKNSEIFGLSKSNTALVAEIAKYHRGKTLPQDEDTFAMLPRTERMTILKLTAILRIADALDRSHSQKLENLSFKFQGDTLFINTKDYKNTMIEKLALSEKSAIFESVFGYRVILN